MASRAAPATRGGPGQDPEDFSLVLGGPLFQLLRRAHLSDDALSLQRRRIIVITLVAWLPLLLLSAIGGQLLGGSVAVPFLLDVEVQVKFLLVVPLLVAAELVVHQRMRSLGTVFRDRRLVPQGAEAQFDAAIASAYRLRNSVAAEVLLIAFVYVVGILFVWRHYMALDTSTWYATAAAEGSRLTPAGMWYGFVSLPFFQFLLLPVVLPSVHLDAPAVAGVAHRAAARPHASGPGRRSRIRLHYGACVRSTADGARRALCREPGQPHLPSRRHAAAVPARDPAARALSCCS